MQVAPPPIMQRPLRVIHYVPGGEESGGGIGRLVGYICQSSSQADHVVVDTRGPEFRLGASAIKLAQAIAGMAIARVTSPKAIHHIHIAGRGSTRRKLILSTCARIMGCTYLLHLHDYDYAADLAERSPGQLRAIRRMFAAANGIVVLGQRDRRTIFQLLGHVSNKAIVLHNAVPDPGPTRANPKSDPVQLLFLGQLGPRKGVPELLCALADPQLADLEWHAVLAGDGHVAFYKDQVRFLELEDRVTIPGWLPTSQVQTLCRRSHILVLPSHGEGLAMAILEGLANGLAVVTTPVGAHNEVLTDNVTGVFVPVGDAKALAAALARLVVNSNERAALSQAGRDHYLKHFSIDGYVAKLDDLYASTVSASHISRKLRRGAA